MNVSPLGMPRTPLEADGKEDHKVKDKHQRPESIRMANFLFTYILPQ